MTSVVKIMGIVGAGGAGLVGIYFVANPEGGVSTPGYHTLFQDSDYNTKKETDYKDKYGHTYGNYLVGVTTASNGIDPKDNDEWWTWAFNVRYSPKKDKVKGAFSGVSDKDALKSKCESAYKASNSSSDSSSQIKATFTDGETSTTNFLESDIWLFCSPFETKVTTIKDKSENSSSYTSSQFGHKETNQKILVYAGSADENKWFWDLKQEELKNDTSLTEETNEFKKLKNRLTGTQTTIEENDKKTLRELCEEAYKQTEDNNTNYPKTDVFKFCSLTGNAPS